MCAFYFVCGSGGGGMWRNGIAWWAHRFVQVVRYSDTQGTELFFSALKLSWGVFLLLPLVSLGAGLRVFWFVVPEPVLAWWFLLMGTVQLIGLLALSLPLRTTATVLGLLTWSVLTASIYAANPRSTLWVLMAVFTAANIGMHVRLRRRAS